MKLAATALAVLLTAAPMAYGQQAEPPASPAGDPNVSAMGMVAAGTFVVGGFIIAVGSDDDDGGTPIATAATATGTAP